MNLLISKNKKSIVFSIILLLGLQIILKQLGYTPEDNISSGDSSVWSNMAKIDNYKNINRYLENERYYFMEHINFSESEQYPQGICMADDYVLVSSYAEIPAKLGKVKIFDKKTGEFLLTLEFDENSHLGGLAFDGKFIWICNSSKMSLECLEYSWVKQMVMHRKKESFDVRNQVVRYRVKNIPSTVTYHKGTIWVATHSIWTKSIMCGYTLYEDLDELKLHVTVAIPPKVQGIAFSEKDELYISTSYGRKKSSYVKKYDSIYAIVNGVNNYKERIKLPPCSEGIVYEDGNLYIIFESAGTKYLKGTDGKGKSRSPLDKILVIQK